MACKGQGIQRYVVLCKANWGQSVIYLQVWHSHCYKSICGGKQIPTDFFCLSRCSCIIATPVNFDIWAAAPIEFALALLNQVMGKVGSCCLR